MSITTRSQAQVLTVLASAVLAAILAAGPVAAAVLSQSTPAASMAPSASHGVTVYAVSDVGVESPVGEVTPDSDWPGN